MPWSWPGWELGIKPATSPQKNFKLKKPKSVLISRCGTEWGRPSLKDKNEAIKSNPTGRPKANQLAKFITTDTSDWLLEYKDSIPGKQTHPAKFSMLQELKGCSLFISKEQCALEGTGRHPMLPRGWHWSMMMMTAWLQNCHASYMYRYVAIFSQWTYSANVNGNSYFTGCSWGWED